MSSDKIKNFEDLLEATKLVHKKEGYNTLIQAMDELNVKGNKATLVLNTFIKDMLIKHPYGIRDGGSWGSWKNMFRSDIMIECLFKPLKSRGADITLKLKTGDDDIPVSIIETLQAEIKEWDLIPAKDNRRHFFVKILKSLADVFEVDVQIDDPPPKPVKITKPKEPKIYDGLENGVLTKAEKSSLTCLDKTSNPEFVKLVAKTKIGKQLIEQARSNNNKLFSKLDDHIKNTPFSR